MSLVIAEASSQELSIIRQGRSLLGQCVELGDLSVAQRLVRHGADVDLGRPLQLAVKKLHDACALEGEHHQVYIKLVRLFLEAGCDVSTDFGGPYLVNVAIECGSMDLLGLVLSKSEYNLAHGNPLHSILAMEQE
eukprot:TRINITY_DN63907_c0_g1_i1.p1 TRINITY_DN63907_c0_g1~~TRINITY_DN63907_c0_g1_i1.p1  ORF type:complete len:135 (+),score=25.80 TRINITY_DN63907_c0_g1_i1:2-406(+)